MRLLLRIVSPEGDLHLTDGTAITVTDRETGEAMRFVPGLQTDTAALIESMSWLSDSPTPREMPVRVLRPGVLALSGRAWLSRLRDDADDYADREPVAEGDLRDVVVDSHVWEARIVDDPEADRGTLLDELASVDATTWPRTDAQRTADGDPASTGTSATDARILGAHYPVVIGIPGVQGLTTAGTVYGTSGVGGPGLLVESGIIAVADDQTILVAADRVAATHVRRISVDSSGLPVGERLPVRAVHDRRGRVVSVVTPTPPIVVDSEQWIAWDSADGGGIADPYGTGILRRMDHVIRWALARSTIRVDWSRLSALSAFRGLQVDTVLTGQAAPWDWLRSQVLPLLPVSVAHGPGGVYLWPWLPALDSLDTDLELDTTRNWTRTDPWQVVDLDATTRLSVAYGLDARSGSLSRRWTLCGVRGTYDDPTTVGLDYWAARLRTTRGERAEVLEAPIVCDDATAHRIASLRMQVSCRPQYVTTGRVRRDARLMPGALVRVLDDAPVLDAVAQVEAVRYTGDDYADVTVRAWAPTGPEV